jgi:hypothetical protein
MVWICDTYWHIHHGCRYLWLCCWYHRQLLCIWRVFGLVLRGQFGISIGAIASRKREISQSSIIVPAGSDVEINIVHVMRWRGSPSVPTELSQYQVLSWQIRRLQYGLRSLLIQRSNSRRGVSFLQQLVDSNNSRGS